MMRRPAFQTGGVRFGHGFPMSRWVKRLMIANFAIFVVMAIGIIPPRAIDWLGFAVPGFLTRPWTIVTYMFVHGGFMHVFMNMLALFFFGPPLEQKWGSRFFLRFYLVTGLGAAAFSVLLYSLTGPTIMVGASGAIFGILVAFALNWPDAKIFLYFVFPVPAKWFVAGLGAFTLLLDRTGVGGRRGALGAPRRPRDRVRLSPVRRTDRPPRAQRVLQGGAGAHPEEGPASRATAAAHSSPSASGGRGFPR